MPEELNPQPAESRTHMILVIVPFIVVALVAGYFWAEWKKSPSRPTEVTWRAADPVGHRAERELTLFYPGSDGGWVTEQRIVRGFESTRQEMHKCLEIFFQGPFSGALRFPGQGRLVVGGVFLDGRGMLILNLDIAEGETVNLGGVQAEYRLIQAIEKTVHANFPDVARLRLMVGGQLRDTLAGHIDIREPLEL